MRRDSASWVLGAALAVVIGILSPVTPSAQAQDLAGRTADLYQSGCPTPRPPVKVDTNALGDGRIEVTVTAGTGALQLVRFGQMQNATVSIPPNTQQISSGQDVKPPTGATTWTFLIHTDPSVQAGGSPRVTVPFTVFDGCGLSQPWQTFAGGGSSALQSTASIADAQITEGNTGNAQLTLTVTLSVPSGQPVSVNFTTVDGTATSGGDFVAAAGTLTFNPGETQKTVTVQVRGDFDDESDESFTVTLSSPVNGGIGRGQATVRIVNDDAGPSAQGDTFTASIGSQLSVPAPGLLANDQQGSQTIQVVSFGGLDAGGAVTSNAAGSTLNLSGGGALSVQATGSFTFTPPAGAPTTFSFRYRAQSPSGQSEATVTINVQAGPAANPDPNYAAVGSTPLSVPEATGVLVNDTRGTPPGNVASFGTASPTTNGAGANLDLGNGGSLTVQANGSFVFTAPTTVTGPFTFQYRLTNPAGSSDATVTINVTRGPIITTTSGATTFTEGGGAVAIDPGVTVTNPGGGLIDSATVVITNPQQGADEVLASPPPGGGITANYAPASHTLTLTGPASAASFETAFRGVTYNNTNAAPNGAPRVVQFQATAGGQASNLATKSVSVSGVNSAPVLANLEPGSLGYAENDPATAVTASLTVTDADHPNLAGGTVGITTGCVAAEDQLQFTDQNGISGTYTAATCTLALTGNSSISNYQTAIRSILYFNSSNNPSTAPRTIAFQVTDGVTGSNVVSRGVNVGAANDNPVVVTTGGTTAFSEGGGAVTVDSGVTVTDQDSATLASASIAITNLLDAGQETLATSTAGTSITANYAPATGTLTLTGPDTVANFQQVLRSVTYTNASATPTTTDRVIGFQVNDGAASSNVANKTVTVSANNSAPVVTTTAGTTAYTEGSSPIAVDPGLTVTDADSPTLQGATVTITNAQDAGAEFLSATGISPNIVATYTAPTLTLSGADTLANYQLALRAVLYENTSNTPTTAPDRIISFVVNDGVASSGQATKNVSVAAQNDAPVVTTTAGASSFTEGPTAVIVDGGVTVTDADSANLASATVTIFNLLDAGQETLAVTGISPSITANYVAPSLTLTGVDTVANYQLALRAVTYRNASNAPTTTDRVINFVANDGTSNSNTAAKTVTVTSVNTPPVVTTIPGTTPFAEDGGAVVIDSGVTVVDADTVNLLSATVTITNIQDTGLESLTATVGATGITLSYAAPTLTLTGPSTVANFEQVLRTVTYNNSSQNPNETLRTLQFQVTDGTDPSNIAVRSVSVTSVNDAPTANDFGAETIGNTVLAVNAAGTNPSPSTPTIVVTGNLLTGSADVDGPGVLTAALGTTTAGATVTVSPTGEFTYSPPPGHAGATDTFTFTVSDGATPTPGTVTKTVTITLKGRVWYVKNDAPAGGAGRSNDPFDTLAEAQAASVADDYIFIYEGNGTSSGQANGISLKTDQKLFGEAHGLIVSAADVATLNGVAGPFTLVTGNAANRPQIANGDTTAGSAAVLIANVSGVVVRGLDLSANQNGVRINIASLNSVVDIANVTVTSAGQLGLQATVAATRTLEFSLADFSATATGAGVFIDGTASAGTTIRQFSNITVTGNTGGAGVDVNGVTFDAASTAGIQQVSGGSLTIGSAGNPNGAGGLFLDSVQGNLFFTDIEITTSGGAGLTASGTGGGFTLGATPGSSNVTTTSGAALNLTAVAANLQFTALTTSTSSTQGVALTSVTGTVSAGSGGSITSTADTAFLVSGGSANVTYNGPITATGGVGVSISGTSGTVAFTGALSLSTGASAAFTASGGGTVTSTATTSALTTTTARALNVSGTTIGAAGLTFQSISSNGAPNGILLANTGSSGGLTVTGDGNASVGGNGSGGTIQNTTSDGISLTNTVSPSFTNMTIQGSSLGALPGSGVRGTQVTNFTFRNGAINNVGHFPDATNSFPDDSNIRFNTSASGNERNLSGTVVITNNVLNNATWNGIDIQNFSGTIDDITVSGNTLTSGTTTGGSGTSKGSAIRINAIGSATTASNVTKGTFANNTIANFPAAAGILIQGGNSALAGPAGEVGTPGSATNVISVTGNLIAGQSAANRMGTSAILVSVNGGNPGARSRGNFDISDNGTVANPLANVAGTVIGVGNNGSATMTATVENNRIVANNTVASNGIGGGNGVVSSSGTETPDLTMTVSNNNISQTDGNGILLVGRGTGGTLKLKINNNTVAAPLTGNRPGIRVDAGNGSSSDDAVFLNIFGNASAASGIAEGMGVRKQGTNSTVNDFGIFDAAGGPTLNNPPSVTDVETFIEALNPSGGGAFVIAGDNFQRDTTQAPP